MSGKIVDKINEWLLYIFVASLALGVVGAVVQLFVYGRLQIAND